MMRAAVYHDREDIRIERVPRPVPGPGQILIAVSGNGICGTDLHEYFHGPNFLPRSPHPLSGRELPLVVGHEFGGEVVEVGAGVVGIAVGDVVAINPVHACGVCSGCIAERPNTCIDIALQGIAAGDGGLAEWAVVDARRAFVLPASVDPALAPLVEPMAVAWHATSRAALDPEGLAVVSGAGPIGIGVALALRAQGMGDVVLVEPAAPRRHAAAGLDLDAITPDELGAVVDQRTLGQGAALAFDCAGVGSTLTTSLRVLRAGGRCVMVAMGQAPLALSAPALNLPELSVVGSMCYLDADYRAVIEAMDRGAFPTHGWVTWIGLDDLVTEGFEALRDARAMKVIVRPDREGSVHV